MSPICPQECMFDTKISTCSSKRQESCTSELDGESRRMPALYPFLSNEVRGMTGWKVEMQPVGQAERRSCLADICDELTVLSRHSWMCSLPAGWGEELPALTDWMRSMDFTVCSWSAPCCLIHCCFPLAQSWEDVAGAVTWLDWWNLLQIEIHAQLSIKCISATYSFLTGKVKGLLLWILTLPKEYLFDC